MNQPLVAVTAASSFTGIGILTKLAEKFSTVGLLSQVQNHYEGLKKIRIQQHCLPFADSVPSEKMKDWILKNEPAIWIHHHHHMADFRLPSYDVKKAEDVGIQPLKQILDALVSIGSRGIIFSGSYFERGEGGPDAAAQQRTPYALSKEKVWLTLKALAQERGISVVKIVIPNPIGPLENDDRLIPNLIRTAKNQTVMQMKTPDVRADNLPVTELANTYARAVHELLHTPSPMEKIFRPSAGTQTNSELVEMVITELIEKRLGLPRPTVDSSVTVPGISYSNPESEKIPVNWTQFWDHYAQVLRETGYLNQI